MFGHGMRHRSIDEITRYSNRYGQARFVSPNAFAYGSDGIHPRFDKIEHLLRKLSHKIFFGTFPGEVRPEFICGESLDLVTRVLHQYQAPFWRPVGERCHSRPAAPGPYG